MAGHYVYVGTYEGKDDKRKITSCDRIPLNRIGAARRKGLEVVPETDAAEWLAKNGEKQEKARQAEKAKRAEDNKAKAAK